MSRRFRAVSACRRRNNEERERRIVHIMFRDPSIYFRRARINSETTDTDTYVITNDSTPKTANRLRHNDVRDISAQL